MILLYGSLIFFEKTECRVFVIAATVTGSNACNRQGNDAINATKIKWNVLKYPLVMFCRCIGFLQ